MKKIKSSGHNLWKSIEVTFSFAEFVLACKQISLFNLFPLRINPILEYRDPSGHTQLLPCPSKTFFNEIIFSWILSTWKNSAYFIKLLWRFCWFKNSAIWNKFKKPVFGPFPTVYAKAFPPPKKPSSVKHKFMWAFNTMRKFRKNKWSNSREHRERRTKRRFLYEM